MVSRIVAMSGPGFAQTGALGPLDRTLLSLTGKERPRVCFLGTALGVRETPLATALLPEG